MMANRKPKRFCKLVLYLRTEVYQRNSLGGKKKIKLITSDRDDGNNVNLNHSFILVSENHR